MAFALLWITVFIMFFQPVYIWPALSPLQPLRNTALLTLLTYLIAGDKTKRKQFISIPTHRYFVVFVFIQITSGYFMLWSGTAIEMLNLWLRIGIVYYLIAQMATNEMRIRALLMAIVLAAAYLSYYSISNFVFHYETGMRVGGFGWYANSNDLAVMLVPCVPIGVYLTENSRGWLKVLFVVITIMFSFNILFTGSRNGLLGLAVAGGFSLYSTRHISRFLKIIALAVLLSAIFTIGLKSVLSRADLAGGISGDESSETRIEQWMAGLRMLKTHPILGIGPGGFQDEAANYGGVRGIMPHNTIIQVFAESGMLGGLSFILFSFSLMFQKWRKILKVNNSTKYIAFALIGFWLCAFFSNRYYTYLLYVLVPLLIASFDNDISGEHSCEA